MLQSQHGLKLFNTSGCIGWLQLKRGWVSCDKEEGFKELRGFQVEKQDWMSNPCFWSLLVATRGFDRKLTKSEVNPERKKAGTKYCTHTHPHPPTHPHTHSHPHTHTNTHTHTQHTRKDVHIHIGPFSAFVLQVKKN